MSAAVDQAYHELSPEQASLFRKLGLHPGPEFGVYAVAAIGEVSLAACWDLLSALIEAQLLEKISEDRYRFSDSIHKYATERAKFEETSQECTRITRIIIEWYAHHAKAALALRAPAHVSWYSFFELQTTAHPAIDFRELSDAQQWWDIEIDNLVLTTHHSAGYDFPQLTLLLTTATSWFLYYHPRQKDQLDIDQLGVDIARKTGDRAAEYHALCLMGGTLSLLNKLDEAIEIPQKALAIAQELNNPWYQAGALLNLGVIYNKKNSYDQALHYLQLALPLSPGAQKGRLEGVIEGNISEAYLGLGRYELALCHAERDLSLRRQAGDLTGQGSAMELIARAHQGLGSSQRAIALCRQALTINGRYPLVNAETLETLGTALNKSGDSAQAVNYLREALAIYEEFNDNRATELRTRLNKTEAGSSQTG